MSPLFRIDTQLIITTQVHPAKPTKNITINIFIAQTAISYPSDAPTSHNANKRCLSFLDNLLSLWRSYPKNRIKKACEGGAMILRATGNVEN